MREEEPKFDPLHVECNLCHDVIFSKYQGQFTTCKCGAISVDQTAYYSRYIGDYKNFIFKESDDNDCSKQDTDCM
jgi:hypothetical protein